MLTFDYIALLHCLELDNKKLVLVSVPASNEQRHRLRRVWFTMSVHFLFFLSIIVLKIPSLI